MMNSSNPSESNRPLPEDLAQFEDLLRGATPTSASAEFRDAVEEELSDPIVVPFPSEQVTQIAPPASSSRDVPVTTGRAFTGFVALAAVLIAALMVLPNRGENDRASSVAESDSKGSGFSNSPVDYGSYQPVALDRELVGIARDPRLVTDSDGLAYQRYRLLLENTGQWKNSEGQDSIFVTEPSQGDLLIPVVFY